MNVQVRPAAEPLRNVEEITIAEILLQAAYLLRVGTDKPRFEAEILLAHTLGCTRTFLHAHPEQSLRPDQQVSYRGLLERRALGEPLPYLTGHIEFFGLDFAVNECVLIPRPETEALVEAALALLAQLSPNAVTGSISHPVLADVGTGSGCIAVTLAVHAPRAHVYAIDLSADALALARANAQSHGVANNITFLQSDLLEDLPEHVDLIVANPPYIAREEWSGLPREVREYEPRLALDGGPAGLASIRRLLSQAPAHLSPESALLLEIGATQGPSATRMARQAFPEAEVTVQTDLWGYDRVLCIKTPTGHNKPID
jgi:release factor glutamine methyltransferase